MADLLRESLENLRSLTIVSQIVLLDRDSLEDPFVSSEFEGLRIGVSRARGEKCSRCWNYSESVGKIADHPALCERCHGNLVS